MRAAPFWLAWPLACLAGVLGGIAGFFVFLILPHPRVPVGPGWLRDGLSLAWLLAGVLAFGGAAYGSLLGVLCRRQPDWRRLAWLALAMLITIAVAFAGLVASGVTPRVLAGLSVTVCTILSLAAGGHVLRSNVHGP